MSEKSGLEKHDDGSLCLHAQVGTHEFFLQMYQSRIDGRLVLEVVYPEPEYIRVFIEDLTVFDGGDSIE